MLKYGFLINLILLLLGLIILSNCDKGRESTIDLIRILPAAKIVQKDNPEKLVEVRKAIDVNGDKRDAIFEHPSDIRTEIGFSIKLPKDRIFKSGIAIWPAWWNIEEGDGVNFIIAIDDGNGKKEIFGKYIDPKHNPGDRKWNEILVDLSPYGEKEVKFYLITDSGPNRDPHTDWAFWGNPEIVRKQK